MNNGERGPPDDIFKRYEERIGSRIAGYYNIYQFFGEDLRLRKK